MSRYPRWARRGLGGALVGLAIVMLWGAFGSDEVSGRAPAASRPLTASVATTARHAPRRLVSSAARRLSNPVFVVGDSLTVGTEPWLRAAFARSGWTLAGVDARVGRAVPEGLGILKARTHLPPTVIVALGTNDLGASPASVSAWLRTARHIVGRRRVIWVNLCLSPRRNPALGGYLRINAALARFAPRFGIEVADWCAFATRRGISPGPDGIHYSPSAYQQRARFYAKSVALTVKTSGAAMRP